MAGKDYRETVRKLLAKAEDPACTTEEAEACTERAMAIMAKHGIDQAMIDAKRKDGTAESDPVDEYVFPVAPQFARDALHLLDRICKALDAEYVIIRGASAGHVFGPRSTLERIDMLFTSLMVQMANAMAREEIPWGTTPVKFRQNFAAGFSERVHERLADIERRARGEAQDAADDGPSVALVLANRTEVAKRLVTQHYPKLGTSTYDRRGAGKAAGRAAGSRADLGQTRVGQGRRAVKAG